jgi:hypothetical protein
MEKSTKKEIQTKTIETTATNGGNLKIKKKKGKSGT